MTIQDLVKKLHTTPFFFIGAGFSRRYYQLPSWEELLKYFSTLLSQDEFAFQSYYNKAVSSLPISAKNGEIYAKIASLIAADFDDRWFLDKNFRQLPENYAKYIHEGVKPFKAHLAYYLQSQSVTNKQYTEEMKAFAELSKKSISGIITTNYDNLLESLTYQYKTFVGQEELLFSNLNYLAEIYKIHGSISSPDSLIITAEDYERFNKNSTYLAAKLLTIFMEYPIIFLGYSINDTNIHSILESIVNCLSEKNISKLQDRFIYVEWKPDLNGIEITKTIKHINNVSIQMTCVHCSDFLPLFEALKEKKISLSVKVLRMLKEELYEYVRTNKASKKLILSGLDNPNIKDEDLVLAITVPSKIGIRGLKGITTFEYYKHIVLDHIEYSADDILSHACPELMKSNPKLPLHKLLSNATQPYSYLQSKISTTFDDIISETIRKNRSKKNIHTRSVQGVLLQFANDYPKSIEYLSYLTEEEIDVENLETFLVDQFLDTKLESKLQQKLGLKSAFYRLIRIYDYLKFKK